MMFIYASELKALLEELKIEMNEPKGRRKINYCNELNS